MEGRILVIRGGAIGDFVLTLPVLQALRSAFPGAGIDVLGYPHAAGLAQLAGLADGVRHLEAGSLAGFFARGGSLDPGWSGYFGRFGIILSYLYDPDGIFRENLGRCQREQGRRAHFVQGPHRPPPGDERHATEILFEPLQQLAIHGPPPAPRIDAGAPSGGDPVLALHPGSGSPSKNWPQARWSLLIERLLSETGFSLLLAGGEAERAAIEGWEKRFGGTRLRSLVGAPLAGLAGELARCRSFLGHDSGITHLAAAVGLGGIALWAGTQEAVWRPCSPRFSILRHPRGLASLEVDAVLEECLARLR